MEIWVNARSASSSEFIMIMCAQEGYNIVGEPTLGLTTGMTCFDADGSVVAIPTYMFKDKNGKIYQPHDSKIKIGSGKLEYKHTPDEILARNVLVSLSKKTLESIKNNPLSPAINNVISEFFDNNYHCSIHSEKPKIYHVMLPDQLYIYVPHKCTTKISSVLDDYQNKVLAGFPVLVDIRNAKFGADKEEFMELFDGLFKPWQVKLLETTHSQDDDFDRDFDKLEKKNLEGQFAYTSDMAPYTFAVKRNEIGRYSGINARFWVNKFSFFGNLTSCILLLYLKHNFGFKDENKLWRHYNYSMHRYVKGNIEAYVYSDKFEA
jgi:hypothetical protein